MLPGPLLALNAGPLLALNAAWATSGSKCRTSGSKFSKKIVNDLAKMNIEHSINAFLVLTVCCIDSSNVVFSIKSMHVERFS